MKRSILFLLVAMFSLAVIGQTKSEQRKAEKAAKKAEKEAQEALIAEATAAAVEARQFVIEADFLSNRYGERIDVQPTLNFIGVDKEAGAFQFASGREIGYNGVGGVTAEGVVKDFKSKETKRGFSVEFRIQTSGGTVFVLLNVSSIGQADATVTGTGGAKLNYSGKFVPLGQSRIYMGSRTF